ncbi:hypothetical protein EBR03_07560, partial [bacterium]|nr:hypothetical protein [bacterium]
MLLRLPLERFKSLPREIFMIDFSLTEEQLAYHEFEVMGLFLDKHPLSRHIPIFETYGIKNSIYVKHELAEGSYLLKLAGVIIKKDS